MLLNDVLVVDYEFLFPTLQEHILEVVDDVSFLEEVFFQNEHLPAHIHVHSLNFLKPVINFLLPLPVVDEYLMVIDKCTNIHDVPIFDDLFHEFISVYHHHQAFREVTIFQAISLHNDQVLKSTFF